MNSAKRWLGAAAVVVALTGIAACTSGRSGSATGGTSDGLRRYEAGGGSANEVLRPGTPSAERGQYGKASGFQPARMGNFTTMKGSGAGGAAGADTGGTMRNYTSPTRGYGAGGTTMGTYTTSTRGYGAGGAAGTTMGTYTSSTRGYGAGGVGTDKSSPCP